MEMWVGVRFGRSLANLSRRHKSRIWAWMASSLSLSISRCAGWQAAIISDWVCARASSSPALRVWRRLFLGRERRPQRLGALRFFLLRLDRLALEPARHAF